ncbi:ABC transporter permease [Castellaniella sp.]|uniref:ABC transporter permease n=1 Tax=Castellaniella sp. TaxID=1955812 RepID=UPI0035632C0A
MSTRRIGSPWRGLGAVFTKELADHISSARMRLLEWLIVLTAAAALYGAIQGLRQTTASDPFVFLRLFTDAQAPLPSFAALLGFLIPLVAIGLGFDTINGEYNRRTMSRILSQPIYRDALLMGKFLAGLAALAVCLICLWLLVMGAGLILLGVPPSGEEILRSLAFLVSTLAYSGVWLAVALLCSVIFRSTSTAALVALGLWLFCAMLWPMLAPGIAQLIAPPDMLAVLRGGIDTHTLAWQQGLLHISPSTLFNDTAITLLSPATRSLGPVFLSQIQGALLGSPLPLSESLALVWPQFTGLIAAVVLLFTAGYVVFQRQEVRT